MILQLDPSHNKQIHVGRIGPMTAGEESIGPLISVALQELDALRVRLDRASDWFSDPDATLRFAAFAKEVERVCREATLSDDLAEARTLVTKARQCLDEMQSLLGLH